MMISCRIETPEDEPFVRQLVTDYATADLAAWSWPQPMRDHLVGIQYTQRRQNIRSNHPKADSKIILVDGKPSGWLVVSSSEDEIHVIEIIILPEHRGMGIGSEVLGQVMAESDRSGRPISLTVRTNNRALRLYQRLGFQRAGGDEIQHFMERPAGINKTDAI